jgi:transposase-like protein
MKYGIKQLRKDFPTDQACLEFAFDTLHSRECSCGGRNVLMSDRPQYYCTKCRKQTAVLSGTIFERSLVPLRDWLYAALLLKQGCSIAVLSQRLEVGYKTGWRVQKLLRSNWKDDTITICRTEANTKKNIVEKTKKNLMPTTENGTLKIKKQEQDIAFNIGYSIEKSIASSPKILTKNYVLKLFLNTAKELPDVRVAEKGK